MGVPAEGKTYMAHFGKTREADMWCFLDENPKKNEKSGRKDEDAEIEKSAKCWTCFTCCYLCSSCYC